MKRVVCFGARDSYISGVLIAAALRWTDANPNVGIVACVDTARRPGPWLERLKQRTGRGVRRWILRDSDIRRVARIPGFRRVAASKAVRVVSPGEKEGVNAPECLTWLQSVAPDCILVLGCPQILGRRLLEIPKLGAVNYHYSALPKYAGCFAPFWTLLYGESESANTFHLVTEGVDAGPIVVQERVAVEDDDTVADLSYRLVMQAREGLGRVLHRIEIGELAPEPQPLENRLYRSAKDRVVIGTICWELPARVIERISRLAGPLHTTSPGGARLRLESITLVEAAKTDRRNPVGTVAAIDENGLVIACADGLVGARRVNRLPARLGSRGRWRCRPGDRLQGRPYDERLDGPMVHRLGSSKPDA